MKLALVFLILCVSSSLAQWSQNQRAKRQRYDVGEKSGRYARTLMGRLGFNKHNKRELTPDTELAELPVSEITDGKEPHIEKIWSKLLEMFTNFKKAMTEIKHTISETSKRVMRHIMNK